MNRGPKKMRSHNGFLQLDAASNWIASFEPSYSELFELFRSKGWSAGKHSQLLSGFGREAARFSHNSYALQMDLEFGGMSFQTEVRDGGSEFQFVVGQAFGSLTHSYLDYDEDVHELLPGDPFPVGEGFRRVLFVDETGKAAMISDILNACMLAADPFILLDSMLFGRDYNPNINDMVVAQGDRITGRPNT